MQFLAPFLFVAIWSTGFIVARAVTPHAAPELVLALRMIAAATLLGGAAAIGGETLPRGWRLAGHLLAGALLNGLYLCLSWWAVLHGMPAGIMALLGALQPLVVALASFGLFGERLGARGWTGLGIGLGGVLLVLAPLLARSDHAPVPPLVAAAAIAAVLSIAADTMIQRGRLSGDAMRISGAVQNLGGAAVAIAAVIAVGDHRWDGTATLWIGFAWSVIGLSIGGISLLVWMTRTDGATRVSALLLLVPPLAAVEAWLFFDETLRPIQLLGFCLALGGVLLARRARETRATVPAPCNDRQAPAVIGSSPS